MTERPGFVAVRFEGKGAKKLFQNEAGGHRWQRVAPTDKRGRVHTSTVTVAVLDPNTRKPLRLDASDVDVRTARGTGPGGQNRNKRDTCVTVTHRETGESVRVDKRSQHQSKSTALALLEAKLERRDRTRHRERLATERRNQVGSGMRGDKIRTYRQLDDRVVDHRTGETWQLRRWLRGQWK